MKHMLLTPFERDLFGAVFAARWVEQMPGVPEDEAASNAFELATYAVQSIRSMEPVFAPDNRAEHEIQRGVFEQVKRRR